MTRPRTSTRDPQEVLEAFGEWFRREVRSEDRPRIVSHGGPSGAGLSSDTLLLDLDWTTCGASHSRRVVLRLPPTTDAFPIFESYDFSRQVEAMQAVRHHSSAPVPEILWSDPTGEAIGIPFFVMERIDGEVPPDVMPYTWGSWVTELPEDRLATMTDDAVDVLVAIHSVPPTEGLVTASRTGSEGSERGALVRHVRAVRRHFDWAANGRSFPTIERGFEIVSRSMPRLDGDDVLLWGDARIGNIIWRDGRAVGVLDWEMTTVGPRELDVAWLVYFAESFQRSAEARGLPGVPSLLRRDDVIGRYEAATGTALGSFDWFVTLTALHQSVIAIRTSDRSIAFGESTAPDDPEAPLYPLPTLTRLLDALEQSTEGSSPWNT